MTNAFSGTPSDALPDILAVGRTDITTIFASMSVRHPEGRDADYLKWHAFDHRPEQYRLAALRASIRLVSTPQCRAARAASDARYDAVDHVMTYMFNDVSELPAFAELGAALHRGGRMPYVLPPVERTLFRLEGTVAAPRVMVGADVLPWWPAKGVYLLIEQGEASASELAEVPGVGGVWWAAAQPSEYATASATGLQIAYCFLDDEPAEAAKRLQPVLTKRWARAKVKPLLAAPFHVLDPFQVDRFLP